MIREWSLLLLLAACTTTKGLTQPVRSVKVTGNDAFRDGAIVDRLVTRPPRGLLLRKAQDHDPIALQLDRRRVEAFYRDHGYFDARVTDVDVEKLPNGVRITITVEEGAPTLVAELEVTGAEVGLARGVLGMTTLRAGRIFDLPEYLLAKDLLEHALVKEGYAHAQVEGVVEVDRPAHRAVIRLRADPGPLVRFGKVKVEGLGRIPDSAVRNRIAWEEGDVFDPEKIQKTEGRLYAMGIFSSVRTVWPRAGRPPVVDMTVKVVEGSRHELRLGFGAGIDKARWELRTRAGFTQHRLLGSPLLTLRIDLTPGYSWLRSDGSSGPSIEAVTSVDREDLLVPRVRGTALAGFQREPREGYILSGPRVNLGLDRPFLDDALQVHAGWELRILAFIDADPMVFGPAATGARLAYYEQRVVIDMRDVPLDARRGFYGALFLNEGGPFAGGVETFFKTGAEIRGYLEVPRIERVVLAARLAGGRLSASGAETPLPLRYYGGGATDHRGFGFRRLSPTRRDADGKSVAIGGNVMVLTSLEARLDLFKLRKEWFSAALFADGGDVVSPPGTLALASLHWATGIGLRYNTIIGPIRFDVGMRLNRTGETGPDGQPNPDPGGRFAFHLSLGEAF